MNSKTQDIEQIGGHEPLTKEEEKRISEYLKKGVAPKPSSKSSKRSGVNQEVD